MKQLLAKNMVQSQRGYSLFDFTEHFGTEQCEKALFKRRNRLCGFWHKTAGIRALPILVNGGDFVPVTIDTITSGQYPLLRFLFIVVNKAPEKPLPKQVYEFLLFILSDQGQELVKRDGYVPVSKSMVHKQIDLLSQVGLDG